MVMQFLTASDGSLPAGVDRAALEAAGVLIVRPTPVPREPGFFAVEGEPEQRDGVWWQTWRLEPVPPAPPPPVPPTVSPRQMRLALLDLGLYDDVEAMVARVDRATQIMWEYSLHYERAHQAWNAMGAMLNRAPEDIDDVFRLAASK